MDIVRERMIGPQKDILNIYDFLIENESLDPELLSWRKKELLKQSLNFLSGKSEYFKGFLNDFSLDKLTGNEELWDTIPIMNKQTLLSNFDEICTDNKICFNEVDTYLQDKNMIDEPYHYEDYLVVSTAGTLGKPGYFAYSREEQAHIRAQYFRFMNAVLKTFKLNEPLRTASVIMTGSHMIGYKMQSNLPNKYFMMIPVMEKGKAVTIEEMAAKLEEFQPHVLTCFGTTLRMLTDYKEENPNFNWNPKAIISTGSTIEEDVKKRTEKVFGDVKVFDLYGSTDTGYIAWTCEDGNMHLNTDCFHIELINDGKQLNTDETMGSIVLTPYWQKTLPLLRYELGDYIVLSKDMCSCGRKLPLVEKLIGRKNTLLYRKIKNKVEPVSQGVIMQIFETTKGVGKFKLVQKDINTLIVKVVPKYNDGTLEARVMNSLKNIFGERSDIAVYLVDDIPVNSESGKFLPVERLFEVDSI